MTEAEGARREPESFTDLPIQPTGSGVADLEIAYEQMKLAEGDAGAIEMADGAEVLTGGSFEGTAAEAESEAHPS